MAVILNFGVHCLCFDCLLAPVGPNAPLIGSLMIHCLIDCTMVQSLPGFSVFCGVLCRYGPKRGSEPYSTQLSSFTTSADVCDKACVKHEATARFWATLLAIWLIQTQQIVCSWSKHTSFVFVVWQRPSFAMLMHHSLTGSLFKECSCDGL